jgi:hypothetical protein
LNCTTGDARKMGDRVLLPKVEHGTTCDACAPMDSSQRASNDAFCRHGGDVIPPARNDSSMRTAMKSISAASCRGGPTNTLGNASSSRVYAACDRTTCYHKQTFDQRQKQTLDLRLLTRTSYPATWRVVIGVVIPGGEGVRGTRRAGWARLGAEWTCHLCCLRTVPHPFSETAPGVSDWKSGGC